MTKRKQTANDYHTWIYSIPSDQWLVLPPEQWTSGTMQYNPHSDRFFFKWRIRTDHYTKDIDNAPAGSSMQALWADIYRDVEVALYRCDIPPEMLPPAYKPVPCSLRYRPFVQSKDDPLGQSDSAVVEIQRTTYGSNVCSSPQPT